MKPNAKGRKVLNTAIRRHMVGGDDLLDSMELVNRLVTRLRERGLAGQDEAQRALDELNALRDLMVEIVQRREW